MPLLSILTVTHMLEGKPYCPQTPVSLEDPKTDIEHDPKGPTSTESPRLPEDPGKRGG